MKKVFAIAMASIVSLVAFSAAAEQSHFTIGAIGPQAEAFGTMVMLLDSEVVGKPQLQNRRASSRYVSECTDTSVKQEEVATGTWVSLTNHGQTLEISVDHAAIKDKRDYLAMCGLIQTYTVGHAGASALLPQMQPGERIVVPATSGDMPMSFFVERM